MNIRTTDSGLYKLQRSSGIMKSFRVTVIGVARVEVVSPTKGDLVTLYTDAETDQQEKIRWYYGDIRIAEISGDLSDICTDVQCNNGTERFRDRLKVDHQTGSLTITDTRTTDSGDYTLQIINRNNSNSTELFSIIVSDVPAGIKRKSVHEGESVTLSTCVIKYPNDVMMWYFNDTLIAEITGYQSKICTDDQCNRFRDRLKVNYMPRSLTITKTRTTDSGLYYLHMSSRTVRISIIKSFSVTVTDPGLSFFAIFGICGVFMGAAVIVCFCCWICLNKKPVSITIFIVEKSSLKDAKICTSF
ncbi:uncharacterized protein LOC131529783 isoform X1 [Onychostoma macrolepis]|uniref:uncharacterized protein LOC131529783 isoform X1 n=1 Tax=Onychostoma macrolepis TaxID=369639 RepID=UPI00272B905C|nr:uncharacterized protein LOC131529783 isoform X1 [Onychostoma macrolepis]